MIIRSKAVVTPSTSCQLYFKVYKVTEITYIMWTNNIVTLLHKGLYYGYFEMWT